MAKIEKFIGKNNDLERLATRIENYLTENKFQVAFSRDVTGESSTYLIQARKAGFLRTASGSRRSTDITITGTPGNFEVTVGTGEWGKNLVTSAPLFVVPVVGIAATVTKLYTAKKFENNLWDFTKDQVKYLQDTYSKEQSQNIKRYPCDYVQGYPGWTEPINGGTLTLDYQKEQHYVRIELPGQKEIKIPAHKIAHAEIVTKKTKLDKPDRMIQITFTNEKDDKIKPVFNFNDDLIRGVLVGIDELVSHVKIKQSMSLQH